MSEQAALMENNKYLNTREQARYLNYRCLFVNHLFPWSIENNATTIDE